MTASTASNSQSTNGDDENSSSSSSMIVESDFSSLTFHEKETRLDLLSEAVLSLAVFLHHHGDRVHICSAKEDLDLSQTCPALHLKMNDVIHRAAASSVGLVYSCPKLLQVLQQQKDSSSSFYNLVSVAREHFESCRRPPHFRSNVLNSSEIVANLKKKTKTEHEEEENSLYFDAEVNLRFVTCDVGIKQKMMMNNNNSDLSKNAFLVSLKSLQKLARDCVSLMEDEEEDQEENISIMLNENNKLRNISGMKDQFAFLRKEEARKGRKKNVDKVMEKSFEVKFVDPTKMVF
jgi:hypothetical protein